MKCKLTSLRDMRYEMLQKDKLSSARLRTVNALRPLIGHPALRAHLHSILTLLRIAKTPEQFFAMVDEAFPKFATTGELSALQHHH